MMRKPFWALMLLLAAPAGRLEARSYQISLNRPVRFGTGYHLNLTVDYERDVVFKIGYKIADKENEDFRLVLDADVDVLKVDEKGRALQKSYHVTTCRHIAGRKKITLVPKGKVVTAKTVGRETKITIVDGMLPREGAEYLKYLFTTHTDSGPDEELYGTDERKQIGDMWPINKKVLLGRLPKDFAVEEKDIVGTAQLIRTTDVDDIECLELSAKCTIRKFDPKTPENVKMVKGEMKISSVGRFPVDPTLMKLEETTNISAEVVFTDEKAPRRKRPRIESKVKQRTSEKRKLIRK